MGETLNLLFRSREDGSYEVQARESWSGRTVSGTFQPPYQGKQLTKLEKRLDALEDNVHELQAIGQTLFRALCGANSPEAAGAWRRDSSEMSVQAMLRSVIQRTLQRRGTVALTLSFTPECEEFVRYPWELLHNGEHSLIGSGIFTLTRAIFSPDSLMPNELPVHTPFRILYMSASPKDLPELQTRRSFEALERALFDLRDARRIYLDTLPQVTFDQLVGYLNSYGGAAVLNDNETAIPCYVVHFDGHGAFGRLCPDEDCQTLNRASARKCESCGASLARVKAQTHLCFCDEEGNNRYIDTETLRDLFLTSDVRLAVLSACETALFYDEAGKDNGPNHRHKVSSDTTLATALVLAQVPAVVAMPYSLQDDLSPTFMFHFYEALAQGRTLEEALSRSRHAMLPMRQSWFIPVLYRHSRQQQIMPVALLADQQAPEEHDQPFAHFGSPMTFVGRERELHALEDLLEAAALQAESAYGSNSHSRLHPVVNRIALTGPAGIGKSTLALEAARHCQEKFPGGVIGVSLQGGKSFGEALIEIAHALHISAKAIQAANPLARTRLILNPLVDRGLPCLLMLDGFEEVKEAAEVSAWHRFLCSLPRHVVVLLTSQTNPATTAAVLEGTGCQWYEYGVGKMENEDLLKLVKELARANGLHDRIHLDDGKQQAILQDICTQLDGYPLGAELIFGMARTIGGKVFTPEAATRSLEEVCSELRETPLPGVWAALEVGYQRLTPSARLLLSYLSAFKLPFSSQQIAMLVDPKTPATQRATVRLEREHLLDDERVGSGLQGLLRPAGMAVPEELVKHWQDARKELLDSSFMQFDGRVYTIHPQVRHFAFSYLSEEERRRVHRLMASYYSSLPQPSPAEWFAAFEHLEGASESHDLQTAVHLAMRASRALAGRGRAVELRAMLRRAEAYAVQLGDKTGEGQVLCCLGAVLRQLGRYPDAEPYLQRSLGLHREQQERDEAGWALYELALLKREQGHYQQADKYASEAVALFREAGDSNGEAWMQITLGEVARGYGRYQQALAYFEQALANFSKAPIDEEGYAWALRCRATIYEAQGAYRKASNDNEEALRRFNTLGILYRRAWVLADMAFIAGNQGDYEQAERNCREAITIFREQHARRGEGWALRIMGDIARHQQKFDEACSYYENALALFHELGDHIARSRVLVSLGAIAAAQGVYPEASKHYHDALTIARDEGARPIEGRALRGLGDVAHGKHNFHEALRHYQQALEIANELNTPGEQSATLRRLGRLVRTQGQYHNALDYLVHALILDQREGHAEHEQLVAEIDTFVKEQNLEEELDRLLDYYEQQ